MAVKWSAEESDPVQREQEQVLLITLKQLTLKSGGTLPDKPIRDVLSFRVSFLAYIPKLGIKIDKKFLNML